jgi:restriction endonuclease XhoI-like protein
MQSPRLPWTSDEMKSYVAEAVQSFWLTRDEQASKKIGLGRSDQGERGKATGGKHLDVFCRILTDIAQKAGVLSDEVRIKKKVDLAGYFRPSKKWDLIVVRNSALCAAIELKSMGGAYGKNMNNRAEECLGSATDLKRAYKAKLVGYRPPFMGYIYVMKQETRSMTPTQVGRPFLRMDPAFQDKSYVDRYGVMCRRVVEEGLYSASCFIVSSGPGHYREPDPELSFDRFAKTFYGHLLGCI